MSTETLWGGWHDPFATQGLQAYVSLGHVAGQVRAQVVQVLTRGQWPYRPVSKERAMTNGPMILYDFHFLCIHMKEMRIFTYGEARRSMDHNWPSVVCPCESSQESLYRPEKHWNMGN